MASEVFETSRQSLMTWIKNFGKDAKNGLEIKSVRGCKPITNAEIKDFFAQFLQKNTNTTTEEFCQIIKEKHGMSM